MIAIVMIIITHFQINQISVLNNTQGVDMPLPSKPNQTYEMISYEK